MLVRSKINLSPGDGEYAPTVQDEDAVVDDDDEDDDEDGDEEDDDDAIALEINDIARGRHQRRSLSRHDIEEARQASMARLSFSQPD